MRYQVVSHFKFTPLSELCFTTHCGLLVKAGLDWGPTLSHLGRMPYADIYKTKLVAFIDLLGFHNTIERSAIEPALQRQVASVIDTFQRTACENKAHDIVLTGFSDSLVMSAAVTPEG
ncbi:MULTISPECIES: hypothetical protein [Brevundimonas]|uniref:hypothetical protein n=1 Tax=Brevundimonas sp. UBA7507 TaxID=1946137 RepID=UPI002579EFD6|nr:MULTISPECIES: hypothetical protein [Brevundimonas]